ncbi:MAG: hypothetical protein ACK5SU_09015 [Phenylobacterium sp.]
MGGRHPDGAEIDLDHGAASAAARVFSGADAPGAARLRKAGLGIIRGMPTLFPRRSHGAGAGIGVSYGS